MVQDINITPKQLRTAPHITRNIFIHPNQYRPGVRDGEKWRTIAAEPVNRAARRMIQREVSSLNWSIVPEDQEDETQKQAVIYYTELLKDYRGLVTRIIKGVTELPQGGAWEVGWIRPGIYGEGMRGTPSFVEHIDASTLHPAAPNNTQRVPLPFIDSQPADDIPPTTIASTSPIVQIDPYNPLRRTIFRQDEIVRMVSNPYDQFGLSWWQESPTEAAFLAIEGLSRIYIYYLKQLMDTPLTGILDMMDFSESSAAQWAKDFRETLEGIDPIKIPILYEHNEPAKWIPMGRNPADMAIQEQFHLFAEMVLTQYGLSISDLRILKGDRDSKAGAAVGNKITMRTGIGFYAELVKDTFQQLLPPFLKFKYTEIDLDDKRNLAQIRAADARTIQTFDWLPVDLKAQQALKWGVLDIPINPEEIKKEAEKLELDGGGMPSPTPGQLVPGEGKVRDNIEDEAKKGAASSARTFAKSLIERSVNRFKAEFQASKYGIKKDKASERLDKAFTVAFRKAGRRMTKKITAKLVTAAYTQFPDVLLRNIDEPMEAKSWTEFLDDGDLGNVIYKQDDLRARIELLMDDLLANETFYSLDDEDFVELVMEILSLAYEDGLLAASELVQGELFGKGVVDSPFVDLTYRLTNSRVVEILRNTAIKLIDLVDSGTEHFLRRMLAEGVVQGLSVDDITDGIQGALFGLPAEEAGKLNRRRIRSIVTTEINRADSQGRLEEMTRTGFKLKTWITRLLDVCPVCIANELKGSVPLDFEYIDVFGPTLGPPGHPDTCHCSLGADADELSTIGTTVEFWTGGGGSNDKALVLRAHKTAKSKKKKAKNAVGHEVRMGRMMPARERDCTRCGKRAQEFHHNNYSSEHVLDVIPLCRSCHKKRGKIPNRG